MSKGVVIHRGPIPTTLIGHHWFDAEDGNRYGILAGPGPDGGNRGWAYVVVDIRGRLVDDSMFTLAEIRTWAGEDWPRPYAPDDDCQTCGIPASGCGHVRPETADRP